MTHKSLLGKAENMKIGKFELGKFLRLDKLELGNYSPMAWWRWYAVDRVGGFSWNYDEPLTLPAPEVYFPPGPDDWEHDED